MNIRACLLVTAALALAGCNASQSAPPAASAPAQSASVTPPGFRLPEGAGCSGEIARYRAVIDNDRTTGNVGGKVADQIEGDIAKASAACQAGRDGEALALVRASKTRHGYPG